jgi:hypothetical protein
MTFINSPASRAASAAGSSGLGLESGGQNEQAAGDRVKSGRNDEVETGTDRESLFWLWKVGPMGNDQL